LRSRCRPSLPVAPIGCSGAVVRLVCRVWHAPAALAALANVKTSSDLQERERWGLFLLTPTGKPVEQGWVNLHLLLWKYIIYELTQVATEDATFHVHSVWAAAWVRLEKKILAKSEAIKPVVLRAESRGDDPPNMTKYGIAPRNRSPLSMN
jgi:hypothetical protein